MRRIYGPETVISSSAQTESTSYDLDLSNMGADHLAIQAIYTDATPSAGAFDSGVYEVQTLTFPAKAGVTDGNYIVVETAAGTKYAIALDTTGGAAQTPTGAAWVAVSASNKVYHDISGTTTAASVAASVETALNALSGFTTAVTTDDTAANGTMTLTQTSYGPTTNPVPKAYDDAGAGSLAGVQTTAGVSSEVDTSTEVISIPSHGFSTGLKGQLTTTGGLPTGLSLATDYYVISVSSSTIKLASSLANASAGTAINISTQGTGVHTFTPTALSSATLKLQGSVDDTNYDDLASQSVTISAAGNELFHVSNPAYDYLRILFTPSAGSVGLTVKVVGKRASKSSE